MIIRRVDLHYLKYASGRREYVKHRIPDDEKEEVRKKIQFMIRDELKRWPHGAVQEFVISFKLDHKPIKEDKQRLKEATNYFFSKLFEEKGNVDWDRTKFIVFRHCEKTVDDHYNFHHHVLVFARSKNNRALLFGKRETMWAMYDTFKKYDPEMAKKFEPYLERGKAVGRGAAPIWQAQRSKEEIRQRLDTLEATPEYKELMATVMARAAYDHHHWQRTKPFFDIPLKLQKAFWKIVRNKEKVRELELQEKRKEKEHLVEFLKKAGERADEIRKGALSTKGIWKRSLEQAKAKKLEKTKEKEVRLER